jgi:catechol 2,3-dioxygenase-like lactoylglutathione lyase family enzyme
MKLRLADYVVVIVADLDRALAFYTGALGLELGHRSGKFAQLATGATRVALFERDAMATVLGTPIAPPDRGAPGFELGFKGQTSMQRSPSWSRSVQKPRSLPPIEPGASARRTFAIPTATSSSSRKTPGLNARVLEGKITIGKRRNNPRKIRRDRRRSLSARESRAGSWRRTK